MSWPTGAGPGAGRFRSRGRRLAPRLMLLPGLMLLPLLLLLLLAAATPSSQSLGTQAIYFYAAPQPLGLMPGFLGFATPVGAPTLALTMGTDHYVYVYQQAPLLSLPHESRWGAFFPSVSRNGMLCMQHSSEPTHALDMWVLDSSPSATPMVLEVSPTHVSPCGGDTVFALPDPDTELLAALPTSYFDACILAMLGSPNGPRTAAILQMTMGETHLLVQDLDLVPLTGKVLAASVSQLTFYLAAESRLFVVRSSPHAGPEVAELNVPAVPARAMVATRLLDDGNACPAGDLILLLDDRRLLVFSCLDDRPTEATFSATLPATAVGSGGRFVALRTDALLNMLSYLLYVDEPPAGGGRPGVWRMVPTPDKLAVTWQQVVLPPAVDPTRLEAVTLLMGPGSYLQALVADGVALFGGSTLGCSTDPTIQCDTPSESTLSPLGWQCVPTRAESPFAVVGQLCGGCAQGHFLNRHVNACDPCPLGALACNPSEPLVCQEPLLLTPGSPGAMSTCTAACAEGFSELAGVCLPHLNTPATSHALLEDSFSDMNLAPGLAVTTVADTHLAPGDGSTYLIPGSVIANPQSPRSGVLLLVSDGSVAIMPSSAIGTMHARSPPVARPLSAGLVLPPAKAYAEVGPHVKGDMASLGFALCLEDGQVLTGTLTCPLDTSGPAPYQGICSTDGPVFLIPFFGGCTTLRRIGQHQILVHTHEPARMLLIFNGNWHWQMLHPSIESMVHLPAMDPPRSAPVTGNPRIDDWYVLTQPTGLATGVPEGLVDLDPRSQALVGGLLAGPGPGPVVASAPVLLLTSGAISPGRPAWQLAITHLTTAGAWEAVLPPGDVIPSGRTVQLPGLRQPLGLVPGGAPGPGSPLHFLSVSLTANAEYPSALVLLTERLVGVSLFWCPVSSGPCVLLPASFTTFAAPIPDIGRQGVVQCSRAILTPGPGHLVSLLAMSDVGNPLPVHLDIVVDCPAGTFGKGCTSCHESCLVCSGPRADQCTRCQASMPGSPGTCLEACPTGLYLDAFGVCHCHETCRSCAPALPTPGAAYECQVCQATDHAPVPLDQGHSPGQCQACDDSCSVCSVPADAEACTVCPPGRWALLHRCVEACPEDHWPDVPAQACRPCLGDCATCHTGSTCATCPAQHFLGADLRCHACDGSCAGCAQAGSCTDCRAGLVFLSVDPQQASLCGSICPPGEYVGPGRCATCHPSCHLCAGSGTACQVCAPGFRWAAPAAPGPHGTGLCVPCPAGCASCTATRCLSCEAGLLLGQDNGCLAACPAGAYGTDESRQPCDVTCGTCTGGSPDQCTTCAGGLDFVDAGSGVGACTSTCPEGQYREEGSGTCVACDAACAACNGPSDTDCWRCHGTVLQDGQCVQECSPGHVAAGGRCLRCHVSCDQCAGVRSTECLPACPDDLLALPAGQSPVRCVPACPAGHRTTPSGCSKCTDHCASCPTDESVCALCERGWLLDSPACVDSCPANSLPMGGLCSTCHASCSSCYGPGPEHCLACEPGAPLLVAGRCYAACPPGTFRSGSACLPCHGTCAECADGPGLDQCTACPAGRALVQATGRCAAQCPAGWFASEARVCVACHPTCQTCEQAAACLTCRPGDLLQPDGACRGACPVGWFACHASAMCTRCPGGCVECEPVGATCTAACTACEEGRHWSGGECVTRCPAGQFAPGDSPACAPCQGPCKTCVGQGTFCTSCHSGLLEYESGRCVSACEASGFAPAAGVCLACLPGCDRCTAGPGQPGCATRPDGTLDCPSIVGCSRCVVGQFLADGAVCLAECPAGYFGNWDPEHGPSGSCLACHQQCATCSGPGPEHCDRTPGPAGSRLGLALGLSLGLLLLLVLIMLLVLCIVRRRAQAGLRAKEAGDAEDATMLNTILEMALPGAILVDVGMDFRPLDESLGSGAQASVHAAQSVGAGIMGRLGCPATVAIKQLNPGTMDQARVALFQNEVALMWLLRDAPNIVRLFGYSDQPPAIVMERYQTDLGTLLHSEVPLSDLQLATICQQWATGLEAMHANGIAHGDLKPANVFARQEGPGHWHVALGDLGTSRNLNSARASALTSAFPELNAMSARYAAPELIDAFQRCVPLDRGHCLPADIYAAGTMLNQCLSRRPPWHGMGLEQVLAAVRGGQRPDTAGLPASGPFANAGGLISVAWRADPLLRPGAGTFRQQCATFVVAAGGLDLR
ncbi:TKL protein kinase [Fonticula alba]|uniref:TKL protein kinase n=1 Tax=Fonticula alba TaxID=691883 RepID=A0A058Z668_FONAL|nr:TKL protein kinase [Fonticula alba]KCV69789.1 TKL protein kinase [Fonticula alba]|eukprot:XP_009495395.1 TKL protein kinase [Fonticula alba]